MFSSKVKLKGSIKIKVVLFYVNMNKLQLWGDFSSLICSSLPLFLKSITSDSTFHIDSLFKLI